jgi:hypothetical protein
MDHDGSDRRIVRQFLEGSAKAFNRAIVYDFDSIFNEYFHQNIENNFQAEISTCIIPTFHAFDWFERLSYSFRFERVEIKSSE